MTNQFLRVFEVIYLDRSCCKCWIHETHSRRHSKRTGIFNPLLFHLSLFLSWTILQSYFIPHKKFFGKRFYHFLQQFCCQSKTILRLFLIWKSFRAFWSFPFDFLHLNLSSKSNLLARFLQIWSNLQDFWLLVGRFLRARNHLCRQRWLHGRI